MSELSYLEKLLDGAEVEWLPLGVLGELVRGNGLPKTDFTEAGIPAIHYGQIYTFYGLSTETTKSFVSQDTAKKLKKVNTGDVVITNTSENLDDVGKALVYLGKEQAVTGGHATIFKPREGIIGKYFAYFTQTNSFYNEKRKYSKGTKVIDVSASDMAKIIIPIPCPNNPEKSLAIQSEIVRILDKFTALTAELTAELTMRKKQYNYYRDQLLSFDDDEVEWKTLGEIGTWHGGGTPSKSRSEFWEDGSIPWISPKDMGRPIVDTSEDYITEEAVEQSSTKLVPANSIAIVVRSSILDKVMPSALIPVPATFNQDMKVVIPHCNISPNYIAHIMRSRGDDILRAAKKSGGSVASIDSKKLFSFRIPVPHLNEQKRIVNILDKFDTLANSITEGLPREIELRQKQYEYYRDLLFSFPRPETASN
ncbi:TPA: restriction endonuclease subunit S [Escherichia coli]|uniref:restriction endonuclease subunit S n=1 Tax=Escherichia coli TaxID=562 RepID=UPI001D224033|nr:restriction endonuclease subunit S [Escherichia coli]EFN8711559.1 restriction endonuclease subunit S [Escherichia coli O130]EFO3528996.1 restriction endonuclease subunit S [Escherichia coli]EFO3570660.1 restriction endonuclease subunit S [Escherichia coli]EHP6461120.1 restriction endonuclease subunit S [Escherichia coli]EJQ7214028.1 restriction endonuclease subunit S [Escherichia coli]